METKEKAKGIPWYLLTFYNNSDDVNRFIRYWGLFATILTTLSCMPIVMVTLATLEQQSFGGILTFACIFGGLWFSSIYFFIGSFVAKYYFHKPKIKANEGVGKG